VYARVQFLRHQMEQPTITVPAKSSIYRRINYTALAVILAIVIANIWLSAIFSGKTILSQQATMMAREFAQQAAIAAQHHISDESYTNLQQTVDDIAQSEHILDAVVYDHQGKVMAQSEGRLSVQRQLQNGLPNHAIMPFTNEVRNPAGKLIGYVSINFLQEDILAKSGEYQSSIWTQVQLMLLLAFVVGILASRAFATMRYRKTKVLKP
jgi:uncharacterized membrane protein affecting hemolysin expression